MRKPILVDTSALAEDSLFAICGLGLVDGKLVVLKSVRQEIIRLRTHQELSKRKVSERAAYAMIELQSLPDIRVMMDTQEPTHQHPDFDILNRAKMMKARILTADSGVHFKAKERKIATLLLEEIDCRLRRYTPELIKLFPPLREISPGDILNVEIAKLGRDDDQGVAYLPAPDRRKIVINGGASYLGATIAVRVERVYQPSPGYEVVFAVPAEISILHKGGGFIEQ